jgi:hypothetical protein
VTTVAPVHAATAIWTNVACRATAPSGDNTLWNYVYTLHNADAYSRNANFNAFSVGLLDPWGISDIVSPQGWAYSIGPASSDFTPLTNGVKTMQGRVGEGPWSAVSYVITWTGPGDPIPVDGTLTFGFDDPNAPVDVTWRDYLTGSIPTTGATSQPVAGEGASYTNGPVYTPAPEPSTLVLLLVGAAGLLAYARRRRQTGR